MFQETSSHVALLQLKKWLALSSRTVVLQGCLTWAWHERHQFLQIFFLSSPLDVWIQWRCLPPQQQTWSSGSWWSALWSVVESLSCGRGQVALHKKVWCAGVLFIHTWECVNYSIFHKWSSNLWLVESFKTQQDFCTSKSDLSVLVKWQNSMNDTQLDFGIMSTI